MTMKSLDVLNKNVDQTVIDNGGMTLDKMVDGTHEQLFELFQPGYYCFKIDSNGYNCIMIMTK